MTTDKVIDASAFAAVTFVEPRFAEVRTHLRGCRLHAPLLLRFEMANVCVKKMRAHPSDADRLLKRHRRSFIVPIQLHDVDHVGVVTMAERLKLSAYDASYLWLAHHLDFELVTLDRKLETAAQAL